ncbi:MAG: Gfo/Idh/MocA family oxidoreductase, partial [Methanomassiliicoccales archaeon]|nr:Gfo/Idh/MocA family oxidoreductase [Methanomassiliicoccales archaeon]
VVALASRHRASAQSAKATLSLDCDVLDTYDELVKREDIDIIDICSPNVLHAEEAIAAVEAGKHVVIEKPIGMDLAELKAIRNATEKAKVKFPSKLKAYALLKKYIHEDKMPEGLDIISFLKMLSEVMGDESKESLSKFSWKMIFVGGMHFQDLYNYDIERVKRCAIHYAVPDGRIIPFCAYNGGPTFREEVEKKFSVPIDEWRRTRGTEHT